MEDGLLALAARNPLKALRTLPSTLRLLLMLIVSFSIVPSLFESLTRSLPARSTKESFPYRTVP